MLATCVLIVTGLAGVDRWFYEHVSRVLDTTAENPLGLDFYRATKPLWLAARYLFGYGLAGAAVLIGVALVDRARMRAALLGLLVAAATGLIANVAQAVIGRARPNQAASHLHFEPFAHLLDKQGVSFPSGEAATAFAFAVVLSALLPRWRAVFFVCATLGAVARLVNGAHYVSDIAAGALLGAALARAGMRLLTPIRTD